MGTKPKPKSPRIPYHSGYLWPTENGTWQAHLFRAYRAYNRRFKTREQAETWLHNLSLELDHAGRPLTILETQDARRALELLPPNYTLTDSVHHLLRTSNRAAAPINFADAATRYLDTLAATGIAHKHLINRRSQINRVIADLGDTPLDKIDTFALTAWLDASRLTGNTRRHYRAAWHVLFQWFIDAGLLQRNPVDGILKQRVKLAPPAIWAPETADAFLRAVWTLDRPLVPYFAVGLFAGVRTAERGRLTPSHFEQAIVISADIAKTRQTRYVTIPDNLHAWLDAQPWPQKLPTAAQLERIRHRLTDAAHVDWPQNVLRHSFASYHVALHRDAGKTAHELGHPNANMLYTHYRNLATHSDAVKYFNIAP